ncbi:MAG: relaxase domain-containing protein, partial [Defluviicoccus sp.]|nr:relaxase domain-containing protein [Defluviicoccus sp.]
MLSIGALGSAAQGASYYERDGYYAKDDAEHRAASAWAGKGADELGLKGPVDPDIFRAVLEGRVPDGSDTRLGRRGKDGEIEHRPGRDLTFSAPKSVSIAALVGGDDRIVEAHDRAVGATLAWVEKNAAETRMKDPETGRMGRAGGQKIVAATFRHDTSRNLDPQLHSHAVLANMVQGEDGKWRSMANEGLYERQKLIGMLYRNELAAGLGKLGYGIEKTHADGRFEIAGVSREAVEAFSTRRAEIEAAMNDRALGATADNPRLAERAALMTRAAKRDIDREELRGVWQKQAADLGLDAKSLVSNAVEISDSPARQTVAEPAPAPGKDTRLPPPTFPESGGTVSRAGSPFDDGQALGRETAADIAPSHAAEAVGWAMAHLSERAAVFSRADLFAATLAHAPGAVTIEEAERAVAALERGGALHAVNMPGAEDSLATDRTVGEERETVAQMRLGEGQGRALMRGWEVQEHL